MKLSNPKAALGYMQSPPIRWLLLLAIAAGGYRWLGVVGILFVGVIAFVLYEMFTPPPRHRKFGLDQAQQAVDNKCGHFGRFYREDGVDQESSQKVARNDPCPCGSGVKYKRCCGVSE